MRTLEEQPLSHTDAALIADLARWLLAFEPAGKIFLAFEIEKIQHNAELMAVLSSRLCSRALMRDYSDLLAKADALGYFPFNLSAEHGMALTDQDFILEVDRARVHTRPVE